MAAFPRGVSWPRIAGACLVLVATGGGVGHAQSGGLPGGSSSVDWAGLRFDVSLVASPVDRIRVRGTAANVTDRTASALLPRCLAWIRLYRAETLVWDRELAEGGCATMQRWIVLAPGEEETEWFTVPVARLLGPDQPSGLYTVRAFVPAATDPRQPPRADMEFTVGRVRLLRPSEADAPPGPHTLAFPGLAWRMSASDAATVLGTWGFREVGRREDGALFYSGASMLGHNAGLVIQAAPGGLAKVVGLMEPEGDRPIADQLRRVLTLLTDRYGDPDRIEGRTDEPASFRAHWLRPGGGVGDYRLRLAVEPGPAGQPVVFRLDGESPEWRRVAARP